MSGMARTTKKGRVVKCDDFDTCTAKDETEGESCLPCLRNLYHATPSGDQLLIDNYASQVKSVVLLDVVNGTCELGDVTIHLAADWKNVKILLNGKECRDVAGLQIMAAPEMLTQCEIIFTKPKEKRLNA